MARDESQTAKAIKIMRELNPGFSIYELEDEAKGSIYNLIILRYFRDGVQSLFERRHQDFGKVLR